MKQFKPSNSQLKTWRKLQRKKYRYEYGLFIAEGERCVQQIIQNGKIAVNEVLIGEEVISDEVRRSAKINGISAYTLEEDQIREIADTENPQGILAICSMPKEPEVQEISHYAGLMIAADAIQDPGNLGTIIRTAVWFECAGVLCGTGTVDPWHPKVVRSTAGATGAIPVLSGNLNELLSRLENERWKVLLLESGEDSIPLQNLSRSSRSVLVIGNEANGIDPGLFKPNRDRIRIEGNPAVVESLNAAIAAGIAIYRLRC